MADPAGQSSSLMVILSAALLTAPLSSGSVPPLSASPSVAYTAAESVPSASQKQIPNDLSDPVVAVASG